MGTKMRCAVAALAVGFAAQSASAEELRFDRLFVVGDSLSDGGTYSQAVQIGAGGQLPNINYRFLTNAPDGSSLTYAEVLGKALGITLQPNIINGVPAASAADINVGGTNYAEGGSRVKDPLGIGNLPVGGITTRPLTEQVDRLLTDSPQLTSNDLVVLWGGANDVFAQSGAVAAQQIDVATAGANMAQAAVDLAGEVARLRAAGAETVIVVTVPDIGSTPGGLAGGPQGAALATGLVNTFNQTLISTLGDQAVIVDSQKLLGSIQADPAKYGFTATNAATVTACGQLSALNCVQGVNATADSEQRVFADGVHPTTSAHKLFGDAAFAGLQAPTQFGSIAVGTLTATRLVGLGLENRLNPTVMLTYDEDGNQVRREVGDVDFFTSLETVGISSDAQQVTPEIEGSVQVAKLGFDVVVAPNATIGAGLSYDVGKVEFANNAGGFDSTLVGGAVFGQVSLSRATYLNAAIGAGALDVTDFTRQFALGPATETYRGETSGNYQFAKFGGGAFVPVSETLLLNPYASYTHEKVTIDGFTESAGAASLSYGDTEYTSKRLTAGLSAIISPAELPDWTINLRGSIEHDLTDDPLVVKVGPDANTLGSVSAPRPDQTWGYVSASFVRELDPGAFISFTASAPVGLSGTSGYVASIAYKRSF